MKVPTRGPAPWELTAEQIEHWSSVYGHDVERECRKAIEWLSVNPERRKTARGTPRFFVAWLNKASEKWPPVPIQKPDDRGHFPPCRTIRDCRDRVLREARES